MEKRFRIFLTILAITGSLLLNLESRISLANEYPDEYPDTSLRFIPWVSSLMNFRLEIPENWKVKSPSQFPNPYLIFAAWSPQAYLEITVEHKDFASLDRFKEQVREDITIFPQTAILEEGETTIDHLPAYWFDYSFPEEKEVILGRIYCFSRNRGFYRIICLSPQEVFEEYLPIFEHIVKSFTFSTD
ncbi:MAG: PsbP-related protein [Candidatus Caldatribacteriaceae bacterium]